MALCTGAGRAGGLGHGILRRLGQAGCRLVVSDLDSVLKAAESSGDAAASVVSDLKAQGFDVIDIACDVSDETSVAEAIKAVMAHYGRLDIVINNAAIGDIIKLLPELSADEWHRVLSVNLTGAFLMTARRRLSWAKVAASSISRVRQRKPVSGKWRLTWHPNTA